MLFCIQQWLTLVLDLVVGGIAITLIAIITTWKDTFSAVQVGVALNLLLSFNFAIALAIKMWTMMEMSIGAVTHVQQFVNNTPSEIHDSLSGVIVRSGWPSIGAIEFHDIVTGYKYELQYHFSYPLKPHSLTALQSPHPHPKEHFSQPRPRHQNAYLWPVRERQNISPPISSLHAPHNFRPHHR